ncbi:MAG: hypothetical protein EZS28_019414 [Streblomastix strix]|uniref:Uncharacterized protein n=1 Tax=Streblomastix strix TaxID=222440 RepID=A0A5J4VS76_9EUKA|nr:MAG: hypothetical protein EZS28_019414 [Streblomastix strix]
MLDHIRDIIRIQEAYLKNQDQLNTSNNSVTAIEDRVNSVAEVGNHSNKEVYRLRQNVRYNSRYFLFQIRNYGDEQDQTELVNVGYGRVTSIAFCTAGGVGEEQDVEIYVGLNHFYSFLRQLHEGRFWQRSFQPLPLLVRRTEEQIEEEGANEELEAQIINNGYYSSIKYWANEAKAKTLNHFIHRRRR